MAHVRVVVGVAAMPILLLAGAGNTGAAATSPALRLVDDTHTITVDVPAAWTDVDTSPVSNPDGTLSPSISASTDLVTFGTSTMRSVPGLFFVALPTRDDTAALVAQAVPSDCYGAGVMPYADGVFVGHAQALGCGPTEARQFVVAATRLDRAFTGYLEIQLVDWDLAPAAIIERSFDAYALTAVVTPTEAASPWPVPPSLVGVFEQVVAPVPPSASGEFHRLTVSADGSYRYQYLVDDTLVADETGTVAATEGPCVIPELHTGTVEFRADSAIDSDYSLAGRGPARWTVGPDPGELSRGLVLPTLGFEFADLRGYGSFDPGVDVYSHGAIEACVVTRGSPGGSSARIR